MVLIGEVSRRAGMATSAVRFYERAGLIHVPERTASGYREYDPSVIERLAFISVGQSLGLTLRELREVLVIRDRGESPCRHVGDLINQRLAEVDKRLDDLSQLRIELAVLAETAAGFDEDDCSPGSVCRILSTGD